MRKGYLIVFVGIDGSGKTTQANFLVQNFKKDGIDVSYVWSRWEPMLVYPLIKMWKNNVIKDNTKSEDNIKVIKDKKKRLLDNPIFRWLWLISFLIDYGVQIFVKVRLKLLKKQLIISDRIFYDSIIDQAINLGNRKDWLLDSLDSFWFRFLFPKPDMVIYVDCPEDIAFSRKNDAPDVEYLADRRKLYLKLADKYKWFKIDGTLFIDEIGGQVRKLVYKKLAI